MGWTSQIANLMIVEASSGGYTGLFLYDPTPGAGNLLASIAPAGVTEPYGNPVVGGGFSAYNALGGNENQLIFVGPKVISLRTGNAGESTHAQIEDQVVGSTLVLVLKSASTTGAADTAEIDLISNNVAGSSNAQGQLIYNNTSNVATTVGQWGPNGLQAQIPGDSNTYDTERLTLIGSVLNVSSASFANVPGLTAPVAAQAYRLDVKLICTQGGGAFAVKVQVTGPSASTVQGFTRMTEVTTGITENVYDHASLPTTVTGPAFPGGADFLVEIGLYIVFSAAGTLHVQAAQGSAGHAWSVNANSFMDLMPVIA